jgi:hypothetical protein
MHTVFFTEVWLTTVAKIRTIIVSSYWPRKRSVQNFWNDLHILYFNMALSILLAFCGTYLYEVVIWMLTEVKSINNGLTKNSEWRSVSEMGLKDVRQRLLNSSEEFLCNSIEIKYSRLYTIYTYWGQILIINSLNGEWNHWKGSGFAQLLA